MSGEGRSRNASFSWSPWALFRTLISLALLAYVLAHAEWGEVVGSLSEPRWLHLLLVLIILPVEVGLLVFKWKILLEAKGGKAPFRRLYSLYVVGQFYNQIFPSSVGGDVVRAAALRSDTSSLMISAGSIVLERLTAAVSVLLLAVGALVLSPALRENGVLLLLAGATVGGFLLLLAAIADHRFLLLLRRLFGSSRRLAGLLEGGERFREYLSSYRHQPRVLVLSILLSVVYYGCTMLSVTFAAYGAGFEPPLRAVVLAVPMVHMVSMIPITIQGLGLAEWAFTVGFAALGASPAAGITAALFIRFRNILWAAGGYVLYLAGRSGGERKRG